MADTDKVSILVVDDLPEKLLVYRSILDELGEEIVTARSGAEALKQVLKHNFAVILLDVNMPIMDGLETATLIRKRPKTAHIPIIFVSAFMDDVRPLQGYAQGAVDYILTPVAPTILRAKVKVFVDLFRMHQQVKRRAEERIVLAEEQAKRAAAEEANRRSAFLAQASATLANSLDLEATLRRLAQVVVPFLADQSVVCLAKRSGLPSQTVSAWLNAADQVMLAPPETAQIPAGLDPIIERVLVTGQCESMTGGAEPLPWSAVILPLTTRDKTLGCLALTRGPSGRQYGASDLSLAEDLASRAGIAIDNALLVRDIQEADRRKDEFLAMLAHELRNPLAPIRNAVEILRLVGPADAHVQNARNLIDRQLRHLTRLVDDLLDVSRITRGKIRLELEQMDLAAAVASAVEASRPLIEAREHEFILSQPAEPIRVEADAARLSQVISNLLNNAAKYTEERGQIQLTLERVGDEAILRVRDTGAGIPPDMLPTIFDPFTQVHQSLDRAHGGLGIGLTLVRRLVELHDGRVEAFSAGPGQGSEFVVHLPVLHENAARTPSSPEAGHATDGSPRQRILVVDDNTDAANSLALVLRLRGHEVRTAHEGPTALALANTFQPQLVLLDIGLPGMDGYEVARRLRGLPGGHRMLIAAVTGYGQEKDRRLSKEAGFNHHLVKPVDPEALCMLLVSRPYAATVACRGPDRQGEQRPIKP